MGMKEEEYINSITKFISKLIVPKHNEIKSFDVKKGNSRVWTFNEKGWVDRFDITFYVDRITADLEESLLGYIEFMRKALGFGGDIFISWDMVGDNGERTDKYGEG